VNLHDDVVSVSKAENVRAFSGNLHPVQMVIAACYTAGASLSQLFEGIEGAFQGDTFLIPMDALGVSRAELDAEIELDEAALIGGGAVGNGFLRTARYLKLVGNLFVVDPKLVGSGNPNRCLYFCGDDVGVPKARVLCEKAQADFPRLVLEPVIGTFSSLVKREGRIRTAIVAADSRRVRRMIQKELPLEVFDASTTEAREVVVHSHRQPVEGACLACIYRHIPDEHARERDIAIGLGVDLADVVSGNLIDESVAAKIVSRHPGVVASQIEGTAFDSLFKKMCAEQMLLSPTGAQVLAPFAFVSSLAGAFLAVELVRCRTGARKFENYMFFSPWTPPSARRRTYRERFAECEFCSREESRKALAVVWQDELSQRN
jgi:molybdopterin/thiamine biosynthesis adenylyltransferase